MTPSTLFFPLLVFSALLLLPLQVLGSSCVTADCHQSLGRLKHPHQPVKDDECVVCHQRKEREHPRKSGKSFALKAEDAGLCNTCHSPLRGSLLHAPVSDGCISCHKPHGTDHPYLLEVGKDQAPLCFGCHDDKMMKQGFMHGPTAVGECTRCHDPHASNHKNLQKAPVRDVCLKCHADFADSLKNAPQVHPPVRDDPCTVCHSAHGTPYRAILNKAVPALCLDCHGHIAKNLGLKTPHKPLQQEGGCSNCHAAHYAKGKSLLAGEEKTVCLGCHGVDKLGNPPLRNILKDLTGKKYLHGPINEGKCTGCHDPHGSDNFRLLKGPYPRDLYVQYENDTYGLCLQCHNKELASARETTKATGFRNGRRNLHYVHVFSMKSRTCRLCHEPHASNGEKLINKEGNKFGGWKIPLNFKINPTGGSCTPGCHRTFKYDRKKPEKY